MMTTVVAGRHAFKVVPYYSEREDVVSAATLALTEFLVKPSAEHTYPDAGTIYVMDKQSIRGSGIFPMKSEWRPLVVRDSTTEFWAVPEAKAAIAVFEDVTKLEGRQVAKPFRWIFSVMLDQQGVMLPHAAAITLALRWKAILLVGASGSGKSSVTGAWLREELPVIGDDRVPVWKHEGKFRVGRLYRSFCLDEAMALQLGIGGATSLRQNGKVVHKLPLGEPWPAIGSEIAAVVSVRVDPTEGMRLRDLAPGDALLRLAPSSLIPSIGVGRGVLQGLTELVSSVPCYELTVGSLLTRTPAILGSLFRCA